MPRLHELIAVLSGKKSEAQKYVTEVYHKLQKPELFDGLRRTYRPNDDGGETLPSESKNPQLNLQQVVSESKEKWKELFDITMAVDLGNQLAKGTVTIDEKVIVGEVPVPTLLFLEKQLSDVKAFLEKLPVPDPSEKWVHDPQVGMLTTEPTQTSRTKKVQKPLVLFPATPEHPAQTQLITEDVIAGTWTQIRYTNRVSADKKATALERVGKLLDAVKTARERANTVDVPTKDIGTPILDYVFSVLK
jgi:hypothetical protein